jgi:hypothetical protein
MQPMTLTLADVAMLRLAVQYFKPDQIQLDLKPHSEAHRAIGLPERQTEPKNPFPTGYRKA